MFKFNSHSRYATNYTSFFLYEFEILEETISFSVNEILDKFIKHPYFRNQSEWFEEKTDKTFYAHNAFIITNLSVKDFQVIKGKDIAETVISYLDKESWQEADLSFRDEYKDTFNKSKWFLDELGIDNDHTFYLDLDWFMDTQKVIEVYWIWDYVLTFVLINESKSRLIVIDYAMD